MLSHLAAPGSGQQKYNEKDSEHRDLLLKRRMHRRLLGEAFSSGLQASYAFYNGNKRFIL